VNPLVLPRADHTVSRHQIDADALKVLYRLRKFNHVAYLVGGSVRDLLLERRPKDFDIGTSAHPHEVKRIFRNCWIIGRRFRLAHVKFGPRTIEVATFRKQVPLDTATTKRGQRTRSEQKTEDKEHGHRLIRRDNTFGTAEEDAFRRDFTINALFYDIASFAVIDYVGGMEDLKAGLIRSIGNPNERFIEDPVRMLRAISLASRLKFRIDEPVLQAITRHKSEILNASPARMIEELYKVLRSGVSEKTFKLLSKTGLLKYIAPEIEKRKEDALWKSLETLDTYRRQFKDTPKSLTNPILLGSLIEPIRLLNPRLHHKSKIHKENGLSLGQLTIAKRDIERLRQLLALQTHLVNPDLPLRIQATLIQRMAFNDALTWLAIHGTDFESFKRWATLAASSSSKRSVQIKRQRRKPGKRRLRRSNRNNS